MRSRYVYSCEEFALVVRPDGSALILDDRGFDTKCRSIESAVHTLADHVARRSVSLGAYQDMVLDLLAARVEVAR